MTDSENLFQLSYIKLYDGCRRIISKFQILDFSDTKLLKCLDRFVDSSICHRTDVNVYILSFFPRKVTVITVTDLIWIVHVKKVIILLKIYKRLEGSENSAACFKVN